MDLVTTVKKDGEAIYNIHLERDFQGIPQRMEGLSLANRKACIVTDSKVGGLYLQEVRDRLGGIAAKVTTFVFEEGEANKRLDTVIHLYRQLIEDQFERGDVLFALGGGVVGDLTGFAAATYLRGVRFVQLPTSLLAMVDSSVGGKTGVDFEGYKNMVGAFHQPSAVYANLSVLDTLSERQYANGFAEVIKMALILDGGYLELIEGNKQRLWERDLDCLEGVVLQSIRLKQAVVEADPFEKNERALLNYGHTLGHAIEKRMDFTFLHGECVSLGMVAASYLSYRRGGLTKDEYGRIVRTLRDFRLPTAWDGGDANPEGRTDEVLELVRNDKKMKEGHIRFILLGKLGKAYIDEKVTEKEMRESLACLLRD